MTKIKLGLLLLIFTLSNLNLSAQNFVVQGKFSGNNLEKSFINVINTSQYTASISQLDGKFKIPAKVGDSILISSVQYKDVKFIVKEDFKTQSVDIPLQPKVTTLEVVDVYSLGLSGDLEKDARTIKIDKAMILDLGSFDISKAYDPNVTTESEFKQRNLAMEKNQPNLPANFDVLNLAKALVKAVFKKKKQEKPRNIEDDKAQNISYNEIKSLSAYLNIEETEIENFMSYAYSNGLRSKLKNNTNQLDLLQLLLDLSSGYNSRNDKKDFVQM